MLPRPRGRLRPGVQDRLPGAWEAQGYTIVANVGNHTTDLDGGHSGQEYLLPNYAFLD